ncbi:MAG: DUF488 domain-containing protein [Romboutsia sp.]|nr:DUF488 domain-containing protein [Romboutsia sp.]
MELYTIGFTQKTAEEFFELLKVNNIKLILDIRLNNSNQLAGFAKGRDLRYFLSEILNINYKHELRFSPTKELLSSYKKKYITWEEYEVIYKRILKERNVEKILTEEYKNKLDKVCLLCSEAMPEKCHRRLLAEYIKSIFKDEDIKIIHL